MINNVISSLKTRCDMCVQVRGDHPQQHPPLHPQQILHAPDAGDEPEIQIL